MRELDQAARDERARLIAEREQVLQDMELLKESLKGEVDIDLEEGDPDLIEREKSAALLATLARKLESIETALRSIEKGLYGVCERCGQPIFDDEQSRALEALIAELDAAVQRLRMEWRG